MRRYFKALVLPFARPVLDRLRARFATREEWNQLHAKLDELARATEGNWQEASPERAQLHARLDELARATEGRWQEASLERAQLHARLDELGRATEGKLLDAQAIHDLAQAAIAPPPPSPRATEPSITVIVPTCDRPGPLERAIRSIHAQTRRPDRVIVVDDGSVDASWVTERFRELDILYLKTPQPRSGQSAARNLALDAVQTSLVAWLDDDNLMWPTWIERASGYLEADSTIDAIYGAQLRDAETSVSDKFWFNYPFSFERLKQGNFVDINQLVHRRGACRFDPGLLRLVDWDFLLRLIGNSPERIVRVPAIASIYSAAEKNRISTLGWPPDLADALVNEYVHRAPVEDGQKLCSCCNYRGAFVPGPNNRPHAHCPQCGSLERHRFLQLMALSLYHFWIPETRRGRTMAIEIAPSGATAAFRKMFEKALTIDSDPDADDRTVDVVASLTDLPISDATADLMLVLHVLEHIPDDRQAMREIARVLLPHGVAVVQVPLRGHATTDEGEAGSVEERIARFGQADHVRFYGDDFFRRLSESGLETIAISPRQSMAAGAIEKYGLLPDQALVFAVRADSLRASEKLKAFETAIRKGASSRSR